MRLEHGVLVGEVLVGELAAQLAVGVEEQDGAQRGQRPELRVVGTPRSSWRMPCRASVRKLPGTLTNVSV